MRQGLCLALGLFLLVGCATKPPPDVTVGGVTEALSQLKKAVAFAIPGGIRAQAPNGRTFVSHYVGMDGNKWDVLSSSAQRAYAEVAILGDRRPYTITILVFVEERKSSNASDQSFRKVKTSKQMAEVVAQRMRFYLEDRRNQRNMIDDFRPF